LIAGLNLKTYLESNRTIISSQIVFYNLKANSFSKSPINSFFGQMFFLKYLSNGYVAGTSVPVWFFGGQLNTSVIIWNPQTGSSIRIYSEHTSSVYILDQIDTDTIVSGSYGTIRIWKISTGLTLSVINVESFSLRVLLNRFEIVCGLENYTSTTLQIYNYNTGELVRTLGPSLNTSVGYCSTIEILNDRYVASGCFSSVIIWDLNTYLVKNYLKGHFTQVLDIIRLSSDFMASADRSGVIIIWDLNTFLVKYNLIGHSTEVFHFKRISSDFMASADESGVIIIWNWLQGTLVHMIQGQPKDSLISYLDMYDSQTLISSFNQTLEFWNISNGQLIQTINTDNLIFSLVVIRKSL